MDDRFKYLFEMFFCKTQNELFLGWVHAKYLTMPKYIREIVEMNPFGEEFDFHFSELLKQFEKDSGQLGK